MSTSSPARTLRHSRVIDAPGHELYGLIEHVTRWPAIFEPCLHVRYLERRRHDERFEIWANVGGEVKSWTSRRALDRRTLRISFRQEHNNPPVAAMSGYWQFKRLSASRTEVVLIHEFAVQGGADELDAVSAAVDANSLKELAALARVAEQPIASNELIFSFSDVVTANASADDVYAFLERSGEWPQRLPHVNQVLLREQPGGVQDMEMETVTTDGQRHTTRSIRLCSPSTRIVYKQLVTPALLFGHSGAWNVRPGKETCRVVATHTVAIDGAKIAEVLGAGTTAAAARAHVRGLLSANSRATLAAANALAGLGAGAATT